MKGLVKVGLILYVAGGLYACGQKGPLVLPDAPKRKHSIPTLPAPKSPQPADKSPAPEQGGAVTPAPPASPAPAPNSTPPQP